MKQLVSILLTLALVASVAALAWSGPGTAAAGGVLVLKFPVVRDFGSGVQGKVLYVRQGLPSSAPLRFASDRVEAVPGFFPAGTCVSVLSAGTRLGPAVAGEDGLSVPVPPPPVEGALEIVESDQPVPAPGTVAKVKSTGGVLRAAGWYGTSNPWSPPAGTVRMLRAHVKASLYSSSYVVRLYGWDGASWREVFKHTGSLGYDGWVDIPPGMTQLKTASSGYSTTYTWIGVPEVQVEEVSSS